MSRFALSVLLAGSLLGGCATTHLLSTAVAPTPAASEPIPFTVTRVTYSPRDWPQRLQADVFQPQTKGPHPTVLLVHGGGWKRGTRSEMNGIAEALARNGFAAVTVDYRLAPEHTHPAPLEDLQEAVRWVRRNDKRYGFDRDRVGVWGYSAGAQLAALLATRKGPPDTRVQAAVLGSIPSDLVYAGQGGIGLVRDYIGAPYSEAPELYEDASPILKVSKRAPPTFIYYGTWDLVVDEQNSLRMREALEEAGVPNEMFVMHRYGHVTAFLFAEPAIVAAIDFLNRQLGERGLSAGASPGPRAASPRPSA